MHRHINKAVFIAAVEASNEGITLSDATHQDMPIIYANRAFYRLTGYTPRSILGANYRILQGKETDRRKMKRLEKAMKEGRRSTAELLHYTKDGHAFWNRLSVAPLYTRSGRLAYYVGVHTNITAYLELVHERARSAEMLEKHAKDLRCSLSMLSNDVHSNIQKLQQLLEPSGKKKTLKSQHHLQTLVTDLGHDISLLSTMLETNSSEILQYVRKRQAASKE